MTTISARSGQAGAGPGGTVPLAGRPVARVGFGVMQLEHASSRGGALAILRQAAEAGINHLDTAQFYGAGMCNALIREALAPYPDDLVLVSKVGAETGPAGTLIPAQRPEQLRAQVEANLTALDSERLDVVNLRRLDEPPGLVAQGDQRVDLDSQLAELSALGDAGKIGAIGLSNVSARQITQARPAGIACVQNLYSVVNRDAQPALDLCRMYGIAWVPFCPLGSAFPDFPKATASPAVLAAAAETGATPGQVALAWLLAGYDRTLLIPGTSNPAHLAENIAAGSVDLPGHVLRSLDEAASG